MNVDVNPKEELIQNLQSIVDTTRARMKENEALLEQHQLEVDRLQQRSVNISTQIKRIEDNFDTVPRQDIKETYEDAIDTKTRLMGMRGQLEKMQDTQEHLLELSDTIADLIDRISGITIEGGGGAATGPAAHTLSLAGEQIVRIIEAGEAERQRLANALHDGPTQSLSNFILQTDICQRVFDRDIDQANEELTNLKGQATATFQKMRAFIFDLRPMMLDDLGLIATMRRYTENLMNSGLNAEFHLTGAEVPLPKHVEVIMFRGLQLLIANARDLLDAKTVRIQMDVGNNELRGVVEDQDGRGFNPDVVLDTEQGDSPLQNLLELRERVELVGGELEIYSAEGQSSRIEIILPFSDE